MGGEVLRTIVAIVTAIIGLAILATLVSPKAKTGSLVQNLAVGLADDIGAATGPVSGGGMQNLSFATN